MGILGLTPFLQKSYPNVVKQLPDRLRSLAGKKIVFDGTLITQRLHFAPTSHAYRHVLGWYRLIKELQDAGVAAICVFDGNERSVAKGREVERRREAQQLAVARGALELDRVKRLNRLSNILNGFGELGPTQKGRVLELFRQISAESRVASDAGNPLDSGRSGPTTALEALLAEQDAFTVAAEKSSPQSEELSTAVDHDNHKSTLDSECDSNPATASTAQTFVSIPPPSQFGLDDSEFPPNTLYHPSTESSSTPTNPTAPYPHLSPLERPFPGTTTLKTHHAFAGRLETEPSSSDPLVALASLYLEFCGSVRKLAALRPVSPRVTRPDSKQEERVVEYSMSKAQIELTADEAKFWEDLASNAVSSKSQPRDESLAALTSRADAVLQSYVRRNNPPTTQTYDESKELLRTMGVPCIDSTGTFEAEALASSLVIHGHADYVASEDTDVILYEAPLLRNITNRGGPLMMLSGSDIRGALELDRQSFIDFALLLGTDFSQRIKNVGPNRALKFIRQYKSIERVIEAEKNYPPRLPAQMYLAEVELARMVFQTLPPVPDAKLLQQESDQDGLSVVLQRFGLGKLLMGADGWDHEEALQGNYFSDDPSAY